MGKPLVSIIVPTYNVERYIDDCIESLLKQSYQNIEIIVIDDASKDATPYLLKKYANQIDLTLNKINQQQGTVRNQALEKAKGKYILFVDSDDWIESNTVSSLVKIAEKTLVDLVRFNGKAFYEGNKLNDLEEDYDFSSNLEEKVYSTEEALAANRKSYSASPCLYLVKKELLDTKKISFPEKILHEDEYFTTMVFVHAESMTYLNEVFYHRRYRLASTMTEITPEHRRKSFDSYLEVFKQLEKEYQSDNYNENQKAFIKRQLISIYSGLMNSDVAPILKKDLKQLESINLKDKLHIKASQLRSYLRK